MNDYKGVQGDAEVEMNYIEDQINQVIMSIEVDNEDTIRNKEEIIMDRNAPRIQIKIPSDSQTRFMIDKVAKQVAREGLPFEEEIKRVIIKRKRIENEALIAVFTRSDEELF
jgi:hypothetical protein